MDGKVSPVEKETRSAKLIELSEVKRREFYLSNIGSESEILFESRAVQGMLLGFTSNYIKVETPSSPALVNSIHSGKLTGISNLGNVKIELI
jgi:threonylcarbamoyladenosine tRNA methylthiotransferase MtaB